MFEKHLLPGQPLRFLLEDASLKGNDGVRLVPQFRENDRLMLYAGLTRVLSLKYDARRGQFHPSSHPVYGMTTCGVRQSYPVAAAEILATDLRRYLSSVKVRPHHLRREGQCQAWVARRFSSGRTSPTDWAVVDSEVIIGFADTPEKDDLWAPIHEKGRATASILAKDPANFGTRIGGYRLGGELDLLLWNPLDRTFLVAEVKDGGSAKGVYLSPLQVGAYVAAWRRFVADRQQQALDDLQALLAQKVRLGVIQDACSLPETASDLCFRPAIIIRNPNERSSCWTKMEFVRRAVESTWCDADPGGHNPAFLAGLAIYALRGDQFSDITQECLAWSRR